MNAVDYKGSTALHLAAWAGNIEVVQMLLEHDETLRFQQKDYSGDCEWQRGNWDQLDIDLCNNDNQTPLSLAAQFGHNQVVEILLRHGANVNIRNNQSESALDLACLNGKLETVRLLLDHSSDLRENLRQPKSLIPIVTVNRLPKPGELQRTQSMLASSANSSPRSIRLGTGWASLLRRGSSNSNEDPDQNSPSRSRKLPRGFSEDSQPNRISDATFKNRSALVDSNGARLHNAFDAPSNHQEDKENLTANLNENTTLTQKDFKFLPLSPLHYATRKGHSNLIEMLLYNYQANVLQVTSIGSVLHEIALSQSSRSHQLVGIFFQYVAASSSCSDGHNSGNLSSDDITSKFLNLKNAQYQTVFQVLNQINNRAAHEIGRSIYMFSEQVKKLNQSLNDTQLSSGGQFNNTQSQTTTTTTSESMQLSGYKPSCLSGDQRQLKSNSTMQNVARQQQFSDMKQINSFVTMKRVPKGLKASMACDSSLRNIDQMHQPNSRHYQANPYLNSIGGDAGYLKSNLNNDFRPLSRQDQYNRIAQYRLPQSSSMTRSVSSLVGLPTEYGLRSMQNPSFGSNITDGHIFTDQQLVQVAYPQSSMNDQNQAGLHDLTSSMSNSHPPYEMMMSLGGLENSSKNHLVRSQTDCSHLMSRFFGDQPSASHLKDGLIKGHGPTNRLAPMDQERKMINRHYQVYDHQFYPPRIIPSGNVEMNVPRMNQTVAVIPPLIHESDQKSTAWRSIATNQDLQTNSKPNICFQLPHACNSNYQSSRLSLNIDPSHTNHQHLTDLERGSNARMSQRSHDVYGVQSQSFGGQLVQKQVNKSSDITKNQIDTRPTNSNLHSNQTNPRNFELEQHLRDSSATRREFDVASREIMINFDEMICKELLHRDHRAIISGSGECIDIQGSSSSISGNPRAGIESSSIITGVSLDMNQRGDKLTVSGTRISLANPRDVRTGNSDMNIPRQCTSNTVQDTIGRMDPRLNHASDANQVPHPNCETRSRKVAPPKPPRPVSRQSAIYDKPISQGLNNRCHVKSGCGENLVRHAIDTLNSQPRGTDVASKYHPRTKPVPPPIPPQPAIRTSHGLTHELRVAMPSNEDSATQTGPISSSSNSSDVQELGLLKMGSLRSTSSSSSSGCRVNMSKQKARASPSQADADSGLCTSNSPTSLSHDSDKSVNSMLRCEINNLRPVSRPSETGFEEKVASSRCEAAHSTSPPSPKTAQMCIEEILMPLAKVSCAMTL